MKDDSGLTILKWVSIAVVGGLLGWLLPPMFETKETVQPPAQGERNLAKEKAVQERIKKVGQTALPGQETVDKSRFTVTRVGDSRLLAVYLVRDTKTGLEVLVFSTGDALSSQVIPHETPVSPS